MLIKGQQLSFDAQSMHESTAMPMLLTDDRIHFFKRIQSSEGDVFKVADGCGNDE